MSTDENTEERPLTAAVAGEDPIVVTGGSVILEYPDQPGNIFDDDGFANGKKGKLKRLKNRSKAELSFVKVFDKRGTKLMEIDLKSLGKKNDDLRIEICYTVP